MNPKLNDFLKANKDITLISIGWSVFWRLYLAMLAVCFVLAIVGAMFSN